MNRKSPTVTFAIDHHFYRVGQEVYTHYAHDYRFWSEYLESFAGVKVFARVGTSSSVPEGAVRADGPGVEFIDVPDYKGPSAFLRVLPQCLRLAWRTSADPDSCFLLRSGNLGTLLWICLMARRRPFARELQGEVYNAVMAYQGKSRNNLGASLLAWMMDALCALQLRTSHASSYVAEFLRKQYPSRNPKTEFVFSDVALSPELVKPPRATKDFSTRPLRVVSVGRLEYEKGLHVLIDAVKQIERCSAPESISLRLVGTGSRKEQLEQKVKDANLGDCVRFCGLVPHGPELFAHLDWADLFVLPSLSEGMPRALVEAMGRGLPTIGSDTGGIVEVLEPNQRVPTGDAQALAGALTARIGNPALLAQESARNQALVTERFSPERMARIKHDFWETMIEKWTHTQHKA